MKFFDRSVPSWAVSLASLATLATLAAPLSALAAPVNVTAGQTVLFNADLTGLATPPFVSVQFDSHLAPGSFTAGVDIGSWTFFTGLNGTGTAFAGGDASLAQLSLIDVGFVDGLYSASFTLTEGDVSIEPTTRGEVIISRNETAFTNPLPLTGIVDDQPNGVPEPSSPALALLALGGLVWSVRRRRAGAATMPILHARPI